MTQVQMKTLKQQGLQLSQKYMANGSVPSNLRKANDVLCCVVFLIFYLLFIGSLTLGIKQGNISNFLYPTGQGFRCGYDAAKDFPFAYFHNPLIHNKTVCTNKCPKMMSSGKIEQITCYFKFRCSYATQLNSQSQYSPTLQRLSVLGYPTYRTAGNLCLPQPSLMEKVFKPAAYTIYSRVSELHDQISVTDISNNYLYIVICVLIGLALSTISHVIIRNINYKNLLLPSMLFNIAVMLICTFTFFYLAGVLPIPLFQYNGYLGLAYRHYQGRYVGMAIAFLFLSLFFIIITILEMYRLKKQIKQIYNYTSSNTPDFTRQQLAIYISFSIVFIIHWALCIFTYLSVVTGNKIQIFERFPKLFAEIVQGFTLQKFSSHFIIIWAIFGSFVITGVGKVFIALLYTQNGAVAKRSRKNQLFDYFVIIFYHHFGSIVLSSFFVPIIGSMIEFALWSLKLDMNKKTMVNRIVKFLKLMSPSCYLYYAITGHNYVGSCRRGHELIWQQQSLQISLRFRIQTEKLICVSFRFISFLFGPFIFLVVFSYVRNFRAQIFQILWIAGIGSLIVWGLADIILFGLEEQSRIRQINNYLQAYQKSNQIIQPIERSRYKQKSFRVVALDATEIKELQQKQYQFDPKRK